MAKLFSNSSLKLYYSVEVDKDIPTITAGTGAITVTTTGTDPWVQVAEGEWEDGGISFEQVAEDTILKLQGGHGQREDAYITDQGMTVSLSAYHYSVELFALPTGATISKVTAGSNQVGTSSAVFKHGRTRKKYAFVLVMNSPYDEDGGASWSSSMLWLPCATITVGSPSFGVEPGTTSIELMTMASPTDEYPTFTAVTSDHTT